MNEYSAPSCLAQANSALKNGDYVKAEALYGMALKESPHLEASIQFNIRLAKAQAQKAVSAEISDKFALVIHAFHLDVLHDLVQYVANFPEHADQYVTFPESFSVDEKAVVKNAFPRARAVPVKNAGQDIGALFSLMESCDFKKYSFICKIHTKKGAKEPEKWRSTLLRGVLGSKNQVKKTILKFQSNKNIKIAGAKELFLYGPKNIFANAVTIKKTFGELVKEFDFQSKDWGFFAGTCFWVRTDLLLTLQDQMRLVDFKPAAYVNDGTPAHAVERMFGMLATIQSGTTLLNDTIYLDAESIETNTVPQWLPRSTVSIVPLLGSLPAYDSKHSKVLSDTAQKVVEQVTEQRPHRSNSKVLGSLDLAIDKPEIQGWIAKKGDTAARNAVVCIDGNTNIQLIANIFRSDLQKNAINDGNHAFSVPIPSHFFNDKKHEVTLIDVETGNVIDRRVITWNSKTISLRQKTPTIQLRGSLDIEKNRPEIHGWLANIGDDKPRTAIVRIDEKTEVSAVANAFRSDLQKNKINKGCHAFFFTIPSEFMDGKLHELILIDAETKKPLLQKTCSWDVPKRAYVTFDEFLKSSMTQPVVTAPFIEEDKRSFAMMENIANRLCQRAAILKQPPLVSVIMPVFNREEILAVSIQSVLDQGYKNWELIVVDDGSTDGSVNVVKKFTDERVKLVTLVNNAGHSAARNSGLRRARGEIITYLDSDNTWDDRYIGATVGAFDKLPDASAIYSGQLLYRGASSVPFAMRYGHFNRSLLENKNFIDLNAFSHRQSLLAHISGFDEDLKRFVDYDLILRASELGKLYSIPVLLSHYFYDKAENTVTNNPRHLEDMKIVRDRLRSRLIKYAESLDKFGLDRPVTVIIPSWQSLEDIRDCIASLTASDYHGKLEIIVVDNASDHSVIDYLRGEANVSRITLIENKRNYGFTYAINQGIARSRENSDILLLNNDAIVQQGAIVSLQRACYQLPDAGMTVPRQILPAGTKTLRIHVPYADEQNDCDVNISAHHRSIASLPTLHSGDAIELSYAPFFAVYIRRDVINEIGPLDAEYGRHYRSDRVYCDLMRNTIRRKLYYVPEAFVIHKLQKATDALRDAGDRNEEFELMFKRNQWDEETANKLNFRKPAWDFL